MQITFGEIDASDARVLDDQTILYVRDKDGSTPELWSVNLDGTEDTFIRDLPNLVDIAIGTDGTVVFVAKYPDGMTIIKNKEELRNFGYLGVPFSPIVSSDGYVALMRTVDTIDEIAYIMPGSESTSFPNLGSARSLSWSPITNALLMAYENDDNTSTLYLFNIPNMATVVLEWNTFIPEAYLSVDDNYIAFVSAQNRNKQGTVTVYTRDTGENCTYGLGSDISWSNIQAVDLGGISV